MKRRSTRRMPSQERSRALCAAIEEAAAHVLVKHGYEGASTARIAERAGVSVGSVYQYFDDKEAVFDALAERLLNEFVQSAVPALSLPDLTLEARLEIGSVKVHQVVARFPQVLRRLAAVPGTRFHERLSSARRRATEAACLLLQMHLDEVIVDDIELAARIVVDVAEGLVLNVDASDDAARYSREVVRLVMLYLTGRTSMPRRGSSKVELRAPTRTAQAPKKSERVVTRHAIKPPL